MKIIVIVYCALSIVVAVAFALDGYIWHLPTDVCNFCSGSGQGDDCPREDKQARQKCIEDYRRCGGGPHSAVCDE
jgi:hypothetical protein